MKTSLMLLSIAIGGVVAATSPSLTPVLRVVGSAVVAAALLVLIVTLRRSSLQATSGEPDSGSPPAHGSFVRITTDTVQTGDPQRRAAIKMLGLGALGALPVLAASGVVDRIVAGPDSHQSGMAQATSATTKDGRIRQWTMFIDLRYCDGCQSQGTPPQCTTACIEGHYAPQPMEWIEVYEGELAGGGTQFIPTPCQQCQNPPCVNVCPVGATFSSPEGTVLIDQERCIGCRICMAACPYDRRFFNWGTPPIPPEATLADYSPDTQTPATRGTVMKCDFCPDMVRDGTLPFCIQACPNDAIWYGDLEENIATNGREIVSASRFLSENSAYRLKAELGTEPRVYYISGHGELVGRDPYTPGREAATWPWVERAEGAKIWSR